MLINGPEVNSQTGALQDSITTHYSIIFLIELKAHYLEGMRLFRQRWLYLLLPFSQSLDLLNRKLTLLLALELNTSDGKIVIKERYFQINL